MVVNSAKESRRLHPTMNQQVQIAPTGLCSITKNSVPLRIINQGPEYFRQQLFPKEVSDLHRPRRKSAVELLAESKPNYVKSASVLCHNQQLRGTTRAQNTAGIRKKRLIIAERRMSAPGLLDKVTDNEQPIKSHIKSNRINEYNKPTFLRPGIISQTMNNMRKSGDDNDIVMENDERQLSARCPSSEYLDNCSMDVDVTTLDNRLDWRDERICSVSDDDSIHGNHSGSHDLEDEAEAQVVKPRIVQRSKSDSHRFSKTSSDFSDFEKISGNSADLEKFFNEMGIEKAVLDPMIKASVRKDELSPQVFESLSSADSPDGRSGCSRGSKKQEEGLAMPDRTGGIPQTSIVERNARIIKWLCNVKKARCKSTSD
ncbi:protein FAM110B-like [Lineus longissimus]|uniref:protein FAM110B-like n=1 Tax=Lineus longissimus TaxID=88925 RepID=UPI002B4F20BB